MARGIETGQKMVLRTARWTSGHNTRDQAVEDSGTGASARRVGWGGRKEPGADEKVSLMMVPPLGVAG